MVELIDKPFDDEERELMEAAESAPDVRLPEAEEARIRSAVARIAAAKTISLRVQPDDLVGIRRKAREAGMPYQTLINSLIHRYVNGGIAFKVPV